MLRERLGREVLRRALGSVGGGDMGRWRRRGHCEEVGELIGEVGTMLRWLRARVVPHMIGLNSCKNDAAKMLAI